MAVVGWLEAGGALRISPRFFESASWIRFERSCSILYGEEDARPEEDVGGVFFAAAAGATGRGAEEAFGDGGVLLSRQPDGERRSRVSNSGGAISSGRASAESRVTWAG